MPYYEQPGATRSINRDGKITLTVTYIGNEEAPDPNLGPVFSRNVVKDVAGQIKTTYQIELDDPNEPNRSTSAAVYEFIATTMERPIEAHPNFSEPFLQPRDIKFIKDKLNTIVSNNDIINWNTVRDARRAASLFGYLAKGITSYLVPTITVRKTYQAASPPSAGLLGKIKSPGVNVPGAPRGATFLLTSINTRGNSGSYSVTEEYLMSGEGGWDTYLYT